MPDVSYVIYIPCYDNDPLTNRGDYKMYLCSVHMYCTGPSFGFSDNVDEAIELDNDLAWIIWHWLQEDHPSAVIGEVSVCE